MSSEWQHTTIGEQATLQRGFDITKAEQRPGQIPVVSSAGISSWHDTSMVKGPGVVLGRKGVVGSVHFITQDFWPHDTSLWVKDFHGNDPRFVYYFFRAYAKELSALDVGSANPTLNRNHVHPIEVSWPKNLEEQLSISDFLGKIDDRITLLRETNATLEAIAQALFKSWFVDFDPMRAKMEGRTPAGMDEATAALFPDSFEATELGLVPRGWEVRTLGSLLTPKRGKSITKSKCIEGEIPVVAGGLEPAYFHNTPNVSSPVVTISASGANAGFVRLYQQDIWASDCSFISARETDAIYFWYIFLKINQEKIYFMQQGAAQPHIYPSDLMRLNIFLPKANQLQITFNALVTNLFERIGLNSAKIQTASSLRDTLLPRLISGQLRLPEAIKAVEEATE